MRPSWVFAADFAVVAVESAAFLIIGYALCKRHKRARYAALAVGAACLSYRILTSTFPHRLYTALPHLILTGIIAPAGFLLLAAALTLTMSKSRQARVLIGVFSVVLTYYVFCDVAYLALKGPELSRLAGRWDGEVMVQTRKFTCGPAAAATLLRAWDITVNEGDLAYAARTSFRGTELPRLAHAIRLFGRYKPLKVTIESTTFDELHDRDRPAILLVKKGRRRHVVTLLKIVEGELLIGDPSSGRESLRMDKFHEHYEWDGRAIVAWRDPAFQRLAAERPEPRLHY